MDWPKSCLTMLYMDSRLEEGKFYSLPSVSSYLLTPTGIPKQYQTMFSSLKSRCYLLTKIYEKPYQHIQFHKRYEILL